MSNYSQVFIEYGILWTFVYLYAINRNVGKLWDAIYRGTIRFFSYCAMTIKKLVLMATTRVSKFAKAKKT